MTAGLQRVKISHSSHRTRIQNEIRIMIARFNEYRQYLGELQGGSHYLHHVQELSETLLGDPQGSAINQANINITQLINGNEVSVSAFELELFTSFFDLQRSSEELDFNPNEFVSYLQYYCLNYEKMIGTLRDLLQLVPIPYGKIVTLRSAMTDLIRPVGVCVHWIRKADALALRYRTRMENICSDAYVKNFVDQLNLNFRIESTYTSTCEPHIRRFKELFTEMIILFPTTDNFDTVVGAIHSDVDMVDVDTGDHHVDSESEDSDNESDSDINDPESYNIATKVYLI